ncbi:MAG: hypothetical protein H6667_01615 [Ardenticatenaceae bacterium]|nr:hypothetical protein [Ardenticatenaceae bacterium]MCB9445318.1 hypothetical protein [Ardenticatenaceae bacterium]
MTVSEPELITIIEGPTPEFQPTPQRWLQSIYEGPDDQAVAFCQLRTGNGSDIIARCQNAWRENRPVKLDFPDEIRMRQQVDVVAMRLDEIDEGQVLHLWVALPYELVGVEDFDNGDFDDFDEDYDDEDDGLDYL